MAEHPAGGNVVDVHMSDKRGQRLEVVEERRLRDARLGTDFRNGHIVDVGGLPQFDRRRGQPLADLRALGAAPFWRISSILLVGGHGARLADTPPDEREVETVGFPNLQTHDLRRELHESRPSQQEMIWTKRTTPQPG